MPAKSEKQRKFFGAVMGAKKGKGKVKGAASKVAKKMPKKQIKKFLKKESALANEISALVESAQPDNVFDFAYQHVMSLYLEKLDAVGEEDDDVDNDGDSDSTDDYLKKRRQKVGAAIGKGKIGKEEAEEHMHCKHAEQGCDCDDCEECRANQED
jgi:hypothetical protein